MQKIKTNARIGFCLTFLVMKLDKKKSSCFPSLTLAFLSFSHPQWTRTSDMIFWFFRYHKGVCGFCFLSLGICFLDSVSAVLVFLLYSLCLGSVLLPSLRLVSHVRIFLFFVGYVEWFFISEHLGILVSPFLLRLFVKKLFHFFLHEVITKMKIATKENSHFLKSTPLYTVYSQMNLLFLFFSLRERKKLNPMLSLLKNF